MSTSSTAATRHKRSLTGTDTSKAKRKRDETHLSSCKDASCTGCAEGEVELVFTKLDGGESGSNEPTAAQFYQFALEESDRSGEMTAVARKLFERAIEAFREEERLTFAQQLSLTGKVQETIHKLKALTKHDHAGVWLHLGRAQLIAIGMELERLGKMHAAEDSEDSEDSEEEDEKDEESNKAEIAPIMAQLNEAIAAFDQVMLAMKEATASMADEAKSMPMVEVIRLLTAIQTLIEVTPLMPRYQGIVYTLTEWTIRQLDMSEDELPNRLATWIDTTEDKDAHRLLAFLDPS
ncbi:hypothetical protein SYNPS1DRAFT_22896 [Syncephalis pseudoplumigaleata]|uniref:Uncharacterized protein n=1 Tax=Syncephalis pseudoplumigaleata TaxID=1712513 RepID=A0A4V1J1H6_9FUNG|nr:hypothetical protein SYNPS1DRAFT_22896 [Syncephalis pseudoplumigaleata]|eukprot:RKP25089.1 hypothetical protein SYNPS1DRAFT_22896 [Syncephalis pseudoplumigaleata]